MGVSRVGPFHGVALTAHRNVQRTGTVDEEQVGAPVDAVVPGYRDGGARRRDPMAGQPRGPVPRIGTDYPQRAHGTGVVNEVHVGLAGDAPPRTGGPRGAGSNEAEVSTCGRSSNWLPAPTS